MKDNIITPLFASTEDPRAAACRDAVKRACAQPAEAPRLVQCDAKGNAKVPAANQSLNLTPFPDGSLFKYSPNSAKPGTYLLHDAAGLVCALVMNQDIADILARGAHLFFARAKEVIAAQDAKDEAAKEQASVAVMMEECGKAAWTSAEAARAQDAKDEAAAIAVQPPEAQADNTNTTITPS